MENQIVCAAVKFGEVVVRGHRHSDCIHTANRMGLDTKHWSPDEGFITSENKFVDRKEARDMNHGKRIEKQICPRCHGTGFSRSFNRRAKYSESIRNKAVKLFDRGFSLREIAKKLKLNHPQTAKNILSHI